MSEQDHLELVQRAYEVFAKGDLPALLDLLTGDVEWNYHPTYAGMPSAQHPWRGREGVLKAFQMLTEALELEAFQPDEFIAGKDKVVVLGHERDRVKATGRVVKAEWVQVFTLREGKISQYREYNDTAAWDAGYSSATS
ncbi:MAG: nuclear transport factor 2 family protein [Deltaproteobacteria bacterium]|nr:nuclear transport factor 2 family protein [Deltaproteobacteria bacterium]